MGVPSLRLALSAGVVAGALALGAAAQASRTATPTLVVNFSATGVVTVALPDGTPVGTTAGTPTTIPAGYYTLVLNGPGGCIYEPLFELTGPGVNLTSDMLGGEVDTYEAYATFQPNATYTWHIDQNQNVVYSFKTTGPLIGVAPTAASGSSVSSSKPTSVGIVGSDIVPFRGKLAVSLTSSGAPALSYKGKRVKTLESGRYTIAVRHTVRLQKTGHTALTITGTRSVTLSAGTWLLMPPTGTRSSSVVVS